MIDKQIRISVRLDKELKDKFMKICKAKAINSSELVRQLLQQWIEEQEAPKNINSNSKKKSA